MREASTNVPLPDVRVEVEGAQRVGVTDSAGEFRLREVPAGWHRVRALRIGYRPLRRDSVLVRSGETLLLDLVLERGRAGIDTLQGIDVTSVPDIVLDPMMTSTTQRISGDEIRRLPVSTVEEAVSLTAGTVGSSYRGGRAGQESFIIDGLAVKNQLDASTGGLGLRVPVDMLTEAALVTNGFSARYGQALSGLINVTTKDGGDHLTGRAAYESDRAFPSSWDYGLDRFVLAADGPLPGGIRFAAAADVVGRLEADPVNAPLPADAMDPRSTRPNLLPHDQGETYDVAAKLRIPLGQHHTIRLFGLNSLEQRLLYDPALKYDEAHAPGRRVSGNLVSAHWQYASSARANNGFVSDLRVSAFSRDFIRGQLDETPDNRFGGFTGRRFHVTGEDIARAQDTAAARAAIPGYAVPGLADNSPWGVPAFFLTGGGRGDLGWNHFNELRAQLDMNTGGRAVDGFFGFELVRQRVRTFQRVVAYEPVQTNVIPAPQAADFSPTMFAFYGETQMRWQDLGFTTGIRIDHFDSHATAGPFTSLPATGVSPRFAVSTVLRGATFVASYGRFTQAPDFQYMVDGAFDDTTRTGRFRAGNPTLGYESATQYEMSVRARPRPGYSLRINVYAKRLAGLVASVPFGLDPDSTIFGNIDYGDVKGAEVLVEREFRRGWAMRVMTTLQSATATATNAFQLFRRIRIAPGGADTIFPASVEFPLDYDRRIGLTGILYSRIDSTGWDVHGFDPLAGLESSIIIRYSSGLPYSRTNATGDTLIDLPNSYRLPSQFQVDALMRRPISVGHLRGSVYMDLRNLTNRRNIIAVRRDTGTPGLGDQGLAAAAAAAMAAHPEAIPYESPRYRPWGDTNHDGLIAGAELQALYLRAAQDYYQPLFAFGPPRLVRLGVEIIF